ncbi:MAG: DNA adenine methylase [Bacteroidetes bacterium]|nr:DNA adenine methylase [Bacteroidota bacterium]
MKKRWKTAPLPFQGQKRFFVRHFEEALKGYPPNAVYVDLFGGSGLLSHTVKARHPDARVVYNDYDGYSERLAAIPQTLIMNKYHKTLTNILEHGSLQHNKKGEARTLI